MTAVPALCVEGGGWGWRPSHTGRLKVATANLSCKVLGWTLGGFKKVFSKMSSIAVKELRSVITMCRG